MGVKPHYSDHLCLYHKQEHAKILKKDAPCRPYSKLCVDSLVTIFLSLSYSWLRVALTRAASIAMYCPRKQFKQMFAKSNH